MPLYEYHCDRCGANFEVLQKFADEPLKVHEQCGGKVERLISPPAFQFKGSGWYVTDYARSGGSSPSTNGKDSKTESGKSESGKMDTKPKSETKSDSKPAPAPAKSSD